MTTFENYQEIADRNPRLPLPVELSLMRAIENAPNERAREPLVEKLVNHNLWLACALTYSKFERRPGLLDDGVAAAVEVIYRLAQRARDEGAPFSAFVRARIHGALTEVVRKLPAVVVSRYGAGSFRDAREAEAAESNDTNFDSPCFCTMIPLDAPNANPDGGPTLHELLPADGISPDELSAREIDLEEALAALDPRARKIIEARYGLGPHEGVPLTLCQASEIFDVSDERIRQIEHESLRKMREVLTR